MDRYLTAQRRNHTCCYLTVGKTGNKRVVRRMYDLLLLLLLLMMMMMMMMMCSFSDIHMKDG
jgi:hypothetical protein